MTTHLSQVVELGWAPYLGKTDTLVSVTMLGRYPVKAQDFWVPAVAAMERVLIAGGYENPCDWIGSYKKRVIAGTDIWSFHSYGGAVDLDYGGDVDGDGDPTIDRNPHVHRRITRGDPGFSVEWQLTEAQVDAVEKIKTVNGKTVWRWLGWSIGDTMHFEPACTPDDARTGIAEEDDMDEDTLRRIVREELVAVLGGDRIVMPDGTRTGNIGVVNSVWHASTHGERMMDQQWRAAESHTHPVVVETPGTRVETNTGVNE